MKNFKLVLVALAFCSCENKYFDNTQELLTYVNEKDNGYFQEKIINSVKFSLMLRPTDLVVAQEIGNEKSKEKTDSLRNKYNRFLYFNLSFSKNNKELLSTMPVSQEQFSLLINELTFKMDEKIHLFDTKKDSFPMVDYVYPRMYGLSKNTSLLLVYDKEKISIGETLFLTIEDFGLNTGEIKFRIPYDLIEKKLILRNL